MKNLFILHEVSPETHPLPEESPVGQKQALTNFLQLLTFTQANLPNQIAL